MTQQIPFTRVQSLTDEFNKSLKPLGLFVKPFLRGDYNNNVEEAFCIKSNKRELHEDTLCFLVASNAHFCGRTMRQFASNLPFGMKDSFEKSPVHTLTRYYLRHFLIARLYDRFGYNIDTIHDFDMINNRPRLLVQTAGHVSGMAYYYKPKDYSFDDLQYGCSLHNVYGGWFGFRGAFVLNDVRCSDFEQVQPVDVFGGNQADVKHMLTLFNAFDSQWRDTIPTLMRYDPEQIDFFETAPSKRRLPPTFAQAKRMEPIVKHKREHSAGHLSQVEKYHLLHDSTDLHDSDSIQDELEEAQKNQKTPPPQKKGLTVNTKPGEMIAEDYPTPAEFHDFVDQAFGSEYSSDAEK